MTNQKRPATSGQLSAVGFKIAGTITRILGDGGFGFEEANHLILNDEKTLETMTEKFCAEIFGIKIDQWTEEKRRVEKFYKKFFNRNIDWLKVSVPAKTQGKNRLDVSFLDISEDEYFDAYAKEFGKDKVWKYYDKISKAIKEQQARPTGNYAFSHVGGDEPDLLNYSYDDGIEKQIKFMVPKEGIISAFRYRAETGKMYDVKGITRFAALDHYGDAMSMAKRNDGRFHIGSDNRGYRNSDYGLRQVSF